MTHVNTLKNPEEVALLKQRNGELEAELARWRKLACTDVLTGTANVLGLRTWLTSRVARNKHEEYYLRIIAIDVNDLKRVNDTHQKGHAAGDAMLKQVGQVLLQIFRDPDIVVARVGGDEFVIAEIYDDMGLDGDDSALTSALRETLGGKRISVAIGEAVGVVTGWGNNLEQQFCELRPEADRRMYADKAQMKQAA